MRLVTPCQVTGRNKERLRAIATPAVSGKKPYADDARLQRPLQDYGMLRLLRTVLPVLPLLVSALVAQENTPIPISISGQLRLRSELDDKGLTQDESTLAHLLRTRLRVTARPMQGVALVAEIQDSRHFGSGDPDAARGTTDASADALDMRQAFVQIDTLLHLPVDLRVGRQEMLFNNERLIGSSNWNNTGRSFDAARGTLKAGDLIIDLFGSRLAAPSPSPTASQNLYGLWGTYRPSRMLRTELYGLLDNNTTEITRGADSGQSLLSRYTAGLYVKGSVDLIDVEIEGIGQTGRIGTSDSAPRRDVRAFLASTIIGVTLIEESNTRLQGLITLLSGDGSSGDTVNETFNTLFGTNHKFYGVMDFFPILSGNLGLVDMSGGIATTPIKGLRIALDGHRFGPQRGGGDGSFGTEIDLQIWWSGVSRFELSGGASTFLPGELARPRVGDAARFWVFIAGQWEM